MLQSAGRWVVHAKALLPSSTACLLNGSAACSYLVAKERAPFTKLIIYRCHGNYQPVSRLEYFPDISFVFRIPGESD